MRSFALRYLLPILCGFSVSAEASAQDQPLVFQHGFKSDSTTWGQLPNNLKQLFKITPVTTTTRWCNSNTQQAAELAQKLANLGDTLALVGHSNGGLVSRNFSRVYNRANRIATIGSPHLGAPLASSVVNGDVTRFGRYIWQTIGSVMSFYNFYDDASGLPLSFNDVYAPAMWWLGSNMSRVFASFGWGGLDPITKLSCASLVELQPNSRFLTDTLNAGWNLAHEASALRSRVSIVSDKSPYNGIFNVMYPFQPFQRNLWIDARWGFYAGAILGYFHYSRSVTPLLSSRASDFLALAGLMIDLDYWFAKLNGSVVPGGYVRSGAYPFDPHYALTAPGDLIVPLGRQHYPVYTREYSLGGVGHTQETQSSLTESTLRVALRQDFTIPDRLPGSVASVTVQPASITIGMGASYQLAATPRDVYGAPLTGKLITWASSNPSVVSISTTGVATSRSSSGAATITATSEGYSGSASVTAAASVPFASVSITGPSSLLAGIDGTFTAVPNGGTPPISYVWKVNGVQRGAGQTLTWAGTSSFTVSVTATDAYTTRSASKAVSVVSCRSGCVSPQPGIK